MRRETGVLAGCVTGIFLAAVEGTVVGTVMPTIVSDLGGLARYNWVFSVYMVAAAVTMPIWGKLSDLYGPRRLFVAGVVVFLAGSMLAGTSRDLDHLIAYRGLQGLGAGALFALPLTILGLDAPPERRGHMLGFAAGTWGVAALLGPPVGSLVAGVLSWHWVFYLNVPFGVLAIALILRHFRDPEVHQRHRLDVVGAALFMLWTFAVLMATQAWREGKALLGFSAAGWVVGVVVLFVLVVAVERRAAEPLVPVRLMKTSVYRVANAGAFLMAFCTFSAITYMPMMTTLLDPTDVARAGLSLVPASIGWTVGSLVGGRIVARVGARNLATAGAAVGAAGFALATQVGPSSPLWVIMPIMFPVGLGIGATSPAIIVTLQNHLGAGHMGVVTSGAAFYRHIGGTFGITVLGVLLPVGGSVAAVAAGVQHVFMAAAGILAATLLLLARMPRSIHPDTLPPFVAAASEIGIEVNSDLVEGVHEKPMPEP